MKHLLKKSFVLLLCVSMAACTSMRVVADGRDAVDAVARDAITGLHMGETLNVHTRDSQPQEILYQRTEGNELVGKMDNTEVRIDLAKVVKIERRESDGMKTAGLAGGIVAVIVALAAAAANSMAKDISGAFTGKGGR